MHRGELDGITLWCEAVAAEDMTGEEKGAEEYQCVAHGQSEAFLNAEQVHSEKSERDCDPNLNACAFFEQNKVKNGDKEHIHRGDEARLARACVDHSHLLNGARRRKKESAENTAHKGGFFALLFALGRVFAFDISIFALF